MKNLTDCFEGLLDSDFDIKDDTLSIASLAKRYQNDLYNLPRASYLKMLERLINPNLPILDMTYGYAAKYPAMKRILSWVASKPKSWLDNQQSGEFYVAFLNQCLTKEGSKRKWKISVVPITVHTVVGGTETLGMKVTVELLTGSSWTTIARLSVYDK